MNVLVTGGAGFIGTNFICHALAMKPDWRIVNLDAVTYAGNPAKQKRWMCACGIQLIFKGDEAVCKACSRKYKKVEPETIREV